MDKEQFEGKGFGLGDYIYIQGTYSRKAEGTILAINYDGIEILTSNGNHIYYCYFEIEKVTI